MRRLVVWNLMTLDGYFEGTEKWDLRFHEFAWGKDLEEYSLEQANEVGTLLFGRTTYDGMAAYWQTAEGPVADFMNSVEKVVVSKSIEDASWNNSSVISDDAMSEVAKLKREKSKDIFVFGSAQLTDGLLDAGLVDEFRVGIVPIRLGAGTPLFKPSKSMRKMSVKRTRPVNERSTVLYLIPDSSSPVDDLENPMSRVLETELND